MPTEGVNQGLCVYFGLFVCLDKVLCVSGWPLIYYLAKDSVKLLIPLPPPPSLALGFEVCTVTPICGCRA